MVAVAPAHGQTTLTAPVDLVVQSGLSLTLQAPPGFALGNATGGAQVLQATKTATANAPVCSVLVVSDPSPFGPGLMLHQGSGFQLFQRVQAGVTGGSLTPVDRLPQALLTFPAGASNEQLTLRVQQTIGASDPLRTGTYSKTLSLAFTRCDPTAPDTAVTEAPADFTNESSPKIDFKSSPAN